MALDQIIAQLADVSCFLLCLLGLQVISMRILPLSAAGQYNEVAFKALDTIIAQAGKANVKLLLTFGDNWQEADSKPAVSHICSILE